MTPTAVQDIRNVALLGHAGSGKTTLLEALLAAAGEIETPGQVERAATPSATRTRWRSPWGTR
jgi:elongation factor G